MPSQISAISSSGCEVITQRCRACHGPRPARSRRSVPDERARRTRPGGDRGVVILRASGRRRLQPARVVLQRDADMAQPVEIARRSGSAGIGIGRLVQAGDDRLDEFARQPYDALIFGLNARTGLQHQPRDVDGEPERENQRQQQIDAARARIISATSISSRTAPRCGASSRGALTDQKTPAI